MGALASLAIGWLSRRTGLSPAAVSALATLVAIVIAAGGLGVIVWRIHAAGYAAGAAAIQARWDQAVADERRRQDIANLDARQHQFELARDQQASEAATATIVQEISNAPSHPDDPDRLGIDRVRQLNRIW